MKQRIQCAECGAKYSIEPSDRPRKVRCKQCEAVIEVPPMGAEPTPSATTESDREPRPRATEQEAKGFTPKRPLPATIVAVLCALQVLYSALVAFLAANSNESGSLTLLASVALATISLPGLAMFGLYLVRPWGWWAAMVIFGGMFLFHLTQSKPLLSLNTDHPDAPEILSRYALEHGVPALIGLAVVALLFVPSVLVAYGVKSKKVERRRRSVQVPSGGSR